LWKYLSVRFHFPVSLSCGQKSASRAAQNRSNSRSRTRGVKSVHRKRPARRSWLRIRPSGETHHWLQNPAFESQMKIPTILASTSRRIFPSLLSSRTGGLSSRNRRLRCEHVQDRPASGVNTPAARRFRVQHPINWSCRRSGMHSTDRGRCDGYTRRP
jgi:hypothetical protein